MRKMSNPFIVLEGLDGAGTTTQARILHEYFTHKGINSFPTYEPTDGRVGDLIRGILTGRFASSDKSGPGTPGEREMALLFAADRLEHSRAITAQRDAGLVVVCDRYIFSSIAYQALDESISAGWVVEINRGCALPDITFLIDVSVEECMRRIGGRNETLTVYEKRDLLESIRRNYKNLGAFYEENFGPLVQITGSQPEDVVHASIVQTLASRFGI